MRNVCRRWNERDRREFVRAWNFADSTFEVSDITGISQHDCLEAASRLRQKGYTLKTMSRGIGAIKAAYAYLEEITRPDGAQAA